MRNGSLLYPISIHKVFDFMRMNLIICIGLYAYAVHNMHIHLIICICIFLFAYVFLEFPYALADLHMHFCICICIIMCICIICNVTTLVIYLIFVFPLGTLSHHPQFPPIFLSIYLLLTIEHLIILSPLFPPFHSPFFLSQLNICNSSLN